MKTHLKKYIGYYFLATSTLLLFMGETTTGLIIAMATLLKAPPFDWVGRMYDWAGNLAHKWGTRIKTWKDKQSKPVRIIVTIIAILFAALMIYLMPSEECAIC
jgi:hypothetical protein